MASPHDDHVYLVLTSSHRYGPVWGVFADAWAALDSVRRTYPGAERLAIREVGDEEHAGGTIYSAQMRGSEGPGGTDIVVQVRRVPVQEAGPVPGDS